MNKKKSLLLALVGIGTITSSAQTIVERPHGESVLARASIRSNNQADSLQSVIIKCENAEVLAASLQSAGYHATSITPGIVTARVPSYALTSLYRYDGVDYVQLSRQAAPLMAKARKATGVDRIQSGDGLDTPYTGKGVLIGVIDQGFEYKHPAFLKEDGTTSRVLAIWNRKGYSKGTDAKPITDKIPSTGDGFDSYGHATHVTNIAAGSKIAENDYYGMAPDADIVMIPSEFSEAEVLEDVKYISDLAEKRKQPWVINMSFGTQLGAHDGTTEFAHSIDDILAAEKGRQIVIAAGNEGLNQEHCTHTFKQDGEVARILVSPGAYGALIDLWGQATDGEKHLTAKPFIYLNGEITYLEGNDLKDYTNIYQIAPFNQKEHWQVGMPTNALQGGKLGLEITGKAGETFHAWTNTGYGDFVKGGDDSFVAGDNRYCIDEFGASTRNTVVAAAYVTSNSWTDYTGAIQYDVRGNVDDIANFSSVGPSLIDVPKPTVAAPGSVIVSAVSKLGSSFSTKSTDIASVVKRKLKYFYYQQMSGTSMATPATTGIIALWLEANPNLTAQQIIDIIKTTSRHDQYTGESTWNEHWGYGKIDAYEGLKEALRLGDATGITAVRNSASPVSINKQGNQWSILFNDNESYAHITVFTLDGKVVTRRNLLHLTRGQEETLSFAGLPAGIYVVNLQTTGATLTKKLLIQ